MLPLENFGVGHVKARIAKQARGRRLGFNLSRKTLAERAGVAESTLKRFELTGDVSIDNLLRIALVMECLGDFEVLFPERQSFRSLDEMSNHERKRGRK